MTFEILTPEKREEFRARIQEELTQKSDLLKQQRSGLTDLHENTQDPIDAAAVVEELAKVMAEIKRLEIRVSELRRALNNFDDFGYCETCGLDIPVARLEFNYATTMCINCKSLAESKQKQFAS